MHFLELCMMPTARFGVFRTSVIDLYSAAGNTDARFWRSQEASSGTSSKTRGRISNASECLR